MRITRIRGRSAAVTLALAGLTVAGCDRLKTSLLEANDPDIIDPANVQSAAGANAVRIGALSRLRDITGGGESAWMFGGLLADEWSTSSTFVQNDETDERQTQLNNSTVNGQLRDLYRARTSANQAIELLNKYKPTPTADIGEMYFVRGFAELQLASDFCNGIPLTSVKGEDIEFGDPKTGAEVFAAALASLDSAIALSGGTDTSSVTINRAAKVARARVLLNLNRYADAATAVAGIPTSFAYNVTSSLSGGNNILWSQGASARRYTVGDSLEGNAHNLLIKNALPFFSAKDPRVPVTYTVSSKGDTTKSQDGLTYSRTTSLWGQTSPTIVASGVDARLIEAEAALKAGDAAGMMSILNTLRATSIVLSDKVSVAANKLPALTDPGTANGRLDLLFREKAFWTFGRGQRLGDLRRLIRQYGRTQDQVFPVGSHYRGGTYGTDVNLPVTTSEQIGNPKFTACLDRNA